MNDELRSLVWERACNSCEYCRLQQASLPFAAFQVDHIIAIQHGGKTETENLALCCTRCNLNKGPNLSGIDQMTNAIVTLFNPRIDSWDDHFERRGLLILGRTATGRATVHVLKMNEDRRLKLRASLQE